MSRATRARLAAAASSPFALLLERCNCHVEEFVSAPARPFSAAIVFVKAPHDQNVIKKMANHATALGPREPLGSICVLQFSVERSDLFKSASAHEQCLTDVARNWLRPRMVPELGLFFC